jgi:hypothetical protein
MSVKDREFNRKEYSWMNDSQWECLQMLSDIYGGLHHVYGIIRPSGKNGIYINSSYNQFATFDFNYLTRAVFMAHDRCIRFGIFASGPKMLKLFFHKRNVREGDISERHPTIETALKDFRETYPIQSVEGK